MVLLDLLEQSVGIGQERNAQMIHLNKKSTAALLASILAILFVLPVSAKNYKQREDIDKKSRKTGVGVSEVELLERVPGPGNDVAARAIFEEFKALKKMSKRSPLAIDEGDEHEYEVDKDRVKYKEKDGKWKIKVWADGTKFTFTNWDYLSNKNYKRIPLEDRFSNEKLEKIGRKYIQQHLKKFVAIESDEELVSLWTEFEIEGAMAKDGREIPETVGASTVYFGRRIRGVDVVGGGSKVAISVANDGEVIGVLLDWPKYRRTGEYQRTLPVEQIAERLSAHGTMTSDVDNVELDRFECGYFDGGARHHDPYGYIQAGCVAYTVGIRSDVQADSDGNDLSDIQDSPNGGETIFPIINSIPAAEEVEWDDNWPETWSIIDGGDFCEETELSACMDDFGYSDPGAASE